MALEEPSTSSAQLTTVHPFLLTFWSAGNWQEVLRAHIDPDQLPVAYGGILSDPDGDPRCRTMVREQRGECVGIRWSLIVMNNLGCLATDQIWWNGAKVLLCPGLCERSVRQQRDHQPGVHVPAGV